MSGNTDQAKGHAKEAVGSLTGNKDLEAEGKADRRTGAVKRTIEQAKDKVEDMVDKAEDKAEEAIKKMKDART